MVEVDILCVVQDGSVINVINVATVGVNTCEKHLEDSIELLITHLQNASSRLTEIIENAEGDMVDMFTAALTAYLLTKEEPLARVIMHIFGAAATHKDRISCLLVKYQGESKRVSIQIPSHIRVLRN